MKNITLNHKLTTYSGDKRIPIEKLYEQYNALSNDMWNYHNICKHTLDKETGESLPVMGITSHLCGDAIWVIAGIHGEEPAGPIAVAYSTAIFNSLIHSGIPMVILPLCNPGGYLRNWRYLYDPKMHSPNGFSIGDAEHLLPKVADPSKPRSNMPSCKEVRIFMDWVLQQLTTHFPKLVIDLHEDEPNTLGRDSLYSSNYNNFLKTTYIYSQGKLGAEDPIAKRIIEIMLRHKHPIQMNDIEEINDETTKFITIKNGIAAHVPDSSIEELLCATRIFFNGTFE